MPWAIRISYIAKSLNKQQENTSNRKYFGSCTTKFIFTCVCVCYLSSLPLTWVYRKKKYYYSIFFRYHQHRNAKIYSDVITYIPNLFPCCVSCCGARYEEDDPGFHVKHLDKTRPFFVTFFDTFWIHYFHKAFLGIFELIACYINKLFNNEYENGSLTFWIDVTRYDKTKDR